MNGSFTFRLVDSQTQRYKAMINTQHLSTIQWPRPLPLFPSSSHLTSKKNNWSRVYQTTQYGSESHTLLQSRSSTIVLIPLRVLSSLQHMLHLVNSVLWRKMHGTLWRVFCKRNASENLVVEVHRSNFGVWPNKTALAHHPFHIHHLWGVAQRRIEVDPPSFCCSCPIDNESVCHASLFGWFGSVKRWHSLCIWHTGLQPVE